MRDVFRLLVVFAVCLALLLLSSWLARGQGLAWIATATAPASSTAAWSPSDEASLVAWFRADDGVTNASDALASDGEEVKGWKDNSGHGNHATNYAAGTTRTLFKANIQNSLPSVRFDGINDYLRADNIYTGYIDGDDTPLIWAMAYRNGLISEAGIWFEGIKAGGTPARIRAEIDGSCRYFSTHYDGTLNIDRYVDWPVDIVNWHVVVYVMTGTTVQWYHDGVSLGDPQAFDVDPLGNGSDIFYIGRDISDSPYYGGDMGEILIFNSASVDPDTIWHYLQARWNTPTAVADACLTTFYTNSAAQNDFTGCGANTYFGVYGWDPGANTTICSFRTDVRLASSVQYRASLWTLSGANLGTQQGSGQWSQTITGIGARQDLKWNFASGMAVSSGTSYALVISPLSGSMGGVEIVYQGGDTAAYSTGQWNGAGVLQASSTRDPKFAVFGP